MPRPSASGDGRPRGTVAVRCARCRARAPRRTRRALESTTSQRRAGVLALARPREIRRRAKIETRVLLAVRVGTSTALSPLRARARAPMLEAKTPASAWKPSRDDGEDETADPAAVDDDVGASTVKGRASGDAREMPTATPVPVPRSGDDSARPSASVASPADERETAWWGEALSAHFSARGDLEAGGHWDTGGASCSGARETRDARVPSTLPDALEKDVPQLGAPPFSAARTARGRLAGDGAVRCFACGGEYTRNAMVLLSRCGHPLCLSCAEAWAEKRGRRCPACKNVFDGWHYGVRAAARADGTRGHSWRVAFHALEPEPDGLEGRRDANARKRKPARSARALAFDDVKNASAPRDATFLSPGGSEDDDKKRRRRTSSREASVLETSHEERFRSPPTALTGGELEDADEDELLAAMREAGGASFQTPAAAGKDAR